MADFRMREVRALMSTTMESILRRAMFELMRIFENSLHDHQLELAQKGEEIVQLKVKLQRVEMRLRDALYTEDPVTQVASRLADVQKEPEEVKNATPQIPVPETDFEVPEDWCAPVGDDTPTNPDDGHCPSVRLRSLSIPLYPVPITKKEVTQRDVGPNKGTHGLRRSKRGSLPVQEGNGTPNKSLTTTNRKVQRKMVRSDITRLLQENEGHVKMGLRSRETKSQDQQKKNPSRKVKKNAAASPEPAKAHFCRFCELSFESMFGRDVHERYHKCCKGCKAFFSSPESLMSHKSKCKKLIALMAKKSQSAASGPLSYNTENLTTPSLELGNNKQDIPENVKSGNQTDGVIKKYSCAVCNKSFTSLSRKDEHMRIHTGERPFFCSLCPKKFRIKQALKGHMMRIHKNEVNPEPTKRDLSQTILLQKAAFGFKGNRLGWKECGTKVPGGFSCKVCSKVKKHKSILVEHYRIHTKEKPYECPCCHKHYRFQAQFSTHYRKCIQRLSGKAMSNPPIDLPLSCNIKQEVPFLQDTSVTT